MLKKVIQWLQKKTFFSAVATLVSGVALGQMISLFTTPIVSRLYSNTVYGQNAILVSTATIVCTVSQAGLASAIMVSKDDDEARKVFMSAFWFQLVISSMFFIGLFLTAPIYQVFEIGINYKLSLFLLYMYIVLNNTNALLRIFVNRKKVYKALFWNSIISALAVLIITIPFGVLKFGIIGFVLANIISFAICIVQMLKKINPFVRISINEMLDILKKYKDYMLFQFPSNMLSTFAIQLPNQCYSMEYGNAALGSYAMSEKIAGIPSRLVAVPINQVYFKTASDMNDEKEKLADFTYSLIKKILLIGAIPLILLLVVGGELFSFVLGRDWYEAGELAAILGFSYLLAFCNNCTSYCRVAIGKQKINLLFSIIQLILISITLLTGIIFGKSIKMAVLAFAIGNSCVQVLDMILNFVCMKKNVKKYVSFIVIYFITVICLGLGIDRIF